MKPMNEWSDLQYGLFLALLVIAAVSMIFLIRWIKRIIYEKFNYEISGVYYIIILLLIIYAVKQLLPFIVP